MFFYYLKGDCDNILSVILQRRVVTPCGCDTDLQTRHEMLDLENHAMPCLHSVLSSAKELVMHFYPKFLPALSQHVYFFLILSLNKLVIYFMPPKILPHKSKKITKKEKRR